MEIKTLRNKIKLVKKGTFSTMIWERPLKTKKAFADDVIIKRTSAVVRTGIDYNHMASTQKKRASGILPAEPQALPWGEWESYPYIIQHKGTRYLRAYLAKNTPKVQYFCNGKEVDREAIEPKCLKSEFKAKDDNQTFVVKIENIIYFG